MNPLSRNLGAVPQEGFRCDVSRETPKRSPDEPGFNLRKTTNVVDTDQLASRESIRSGSTSSYTLIENTCLQLECCSLQDTNWGVV